MKQSDADLQVYMLCLWETVGPRFPMTGSFHVDSRRTLTGKDLEKGQRDGRVPRTNARCSVASLVLEDESEHAQSPRLRIAICGIPGACDIEGIEELTSDVGGSWYPQIACFGP